MYFCSKEQTSKQDKAKHSKQNGFQIVTRTPAYCAEHPSTKGCRFSIQSYINILYGRWLLQVFWCNEQGELLNFMITPGYIDDRKPLEYKAFIDFIYGKLFGDKGYIGKNLF